MACINPTAKNPELGNHRLSGLSEYKFASAQVEPSTSPNDIAEIIVPKTRFLMNPKIQIGLYQLMTEIKPNSSVWAGQLVGNGGRDVVIYLPANSHPSEDFHLIYHFHGTHSQHIEKQREGLVKERWVGWNRLQQTLEAADELQQKRKYNVVLIYPFSAGKRKEPDRQGWFNGAYDRMWMAAESFDTLHQEVTDILRHEFNVPVTKIRSSVIAEGHSAGGIALRNIAIKGTNLVGEYLFQDASFQGWADGAYAAIQASNSGAKVTLVVTERGIADPFRGRDPWCKNLEISYNTWIQNRSWCDKHSNGIPEGIKQSCSQLKTKSEEWVASQLWCEEMKTDMKGMPGMFVYWTKIAHGKHPRHFTGGLELPEER